MLRGPQWSSIRGLTLLDWPLAVFTSYRVPTSLGPAVYHPALLSMHHALE